MTRRSPLLAFALALLALTGCGGFSSGNAPGLEAPPPPEFSKPEVQGRVSGRIVVEPGFLGVLARRVTLALPGDEAAGVPEDPDAPDVPDTPAREASPDRPDRPDGGAAGAGDVYQAMQVRLDGVRRKRVAAVEADGSFDVETLPDGEYKVQVLLQGSPLAGFPALVGRQETTRVQLTLLGYDLADLDGDGSREDLAVRLDVHVGRKGAGFTRVVMPDGTVRGELPNGGLEYLLPGGLVRREEPGQGASFREDHDLDGLADPDDSDYRRLREKPRGTRPADLLTGRAFPPLIRWAGASGPFGEGAPGDLVLFQAELARSFAAAPAQVLASLHGVEGPPYQFELRDDGGEVDLNPEWPGLQPSGDLVEGDGIFSHLLPLDSTTAPFLFGREVVVLAKDAEGRASNRFAFFLYEDRLREPVRTRLSRPAQRPWDHVRDLEFLGRSTATGPELQARFLASEQLEGLVATLVGPGDFRKVFAPTARGGSGWQAFETRPSLVQGDGIYYLVIGVPEGPIYYGGRRFSRESLRPTRTGG